MTTKLRKRKLAPIDGLDGFVRARLTGTHATLTVEGRDGDDRSVAGIGLPLPALDRLLRRLTSIRGALARKLNG